MQEGHNSWLAFLYGVKIGPYHLLPEWLPESVPWAVFAALVLILLGYLGTRRTRLVPRGLQTAVEYIVTSLVNFTQSIMGDQRGRDFAPFIGTLFLFILLMNLTGLVPGMKSPTANLNTTAALAVVVFLATQFYGVRTHGVFGYVRHMVADVLILPWYMAIPLAPFMFVLHVISELVRPLSLAMRLFGNITGKEVVLAILAGLATLLLMFFRVHVSSFDVMGSEVTVNAPAMFGFVGLLLSAAIMPLGILMGIIQALVFALLAALYITLATESETEHGHA